MTARRLTTEDVAWGPSGLVPAVLQDAADGRVLMVAYVDAEALAATLATGEVHFHSRSHDRLWRKGETSGNVLRLLEIAVDCDRDALLLQVDPAGPTCHRNTRSCFDSPGAWEVAPPASDTPATVPAGPDPGAGPCTADGSGPADGPATADRAATVAPGEGFGWLEALWATIDSRAGADPNASYTARLLAAGVDGPARKVAEEATEVLMAAKDDAATPPESRSATRDALTGEVADLLYHTLVLLRERDLPPSAVIARLRERHRPDLPTA